MMNAKEMFEKLGYIENNDREDTLRYTIKNMVGDIVEIRFYFSDKLFLKEGYEDDLAYCITYDELKAINKQAEELGWDK